MLSELIPYHQRMAHQGHRRLLVLCGEQGWGQEQAFQLTSNFSGDWVWIGQAAPNGIEHVPPSKVRGLLGRSFHHAVFDGTQALDVEALAALAGTLIAGSWLVLLLPEWQYWAGHKDADSVRWSDCSSPINTPHFMQHMQQTLLDDSDVLIWRQGEVFLSPHLPKEMGADHWSPPVGSPTEEQQALLQRLLQAKTGIWVLTAGRGRGKSTVSGMLAQRWQGEGQCWLTGPNQASTATVQQYAQKNIHFFAPDALLAQCQRLPPNDVDWLLVDEAAAIPSPLLYQLVAFFPRVLLTTTVQGYEGTGRGFLLKLCAGLPEWQALTLDNPIRWAADDPLERFIDNLLLFYGSDENDNGPQGSEWHLLSLSQQHLVSQPLLLAQFYQLLTSAHYRTRPLDLRRLMDAPGMSYGLAVTPKAQVLAGIWLVNEGGLDESLARDIWAGRRRPRGNLVAQSLAAHSGQWQAAVLVSSRISRIAVLPRYRRQGIATALIQQQIQEAQRRGDDFVSVSFGYTSELCDFWLANGFSLVRIGSQKEASSGCYAAMAIYPLSEPGKRLCSQATAQLKRDWHWQQPYMDIQLPLINDLPDDILTDSDWQELAGFAYAHRPLEASRPALHRFLNISTSALTALRQHLQQGYSLENTARLCHVSGKKTLLTRFRQELAQALVEEEEVQYHEWQQWVCRTYTSDRGS